jgi:redox-sensitive bicupin YhaK (pirin superfamily)
MMAPFLFCLPALYGNLADENRAGATILRFGPYQPEMRMNLIEFTIAPREKDIGGFSVHRVLPYTKRRMVGPFIFLDHMGPAQFAAQQGIDVRPHPHIGLATVTYLFAGKIMHRDTLGSIQSIVPGDVNWMTAGRGIAHSERTDADERLYPHSVHGLQSWIALPRESEETSPEFYHHHSAALPEFTLNGAKLKIIAGKAYTHEAPVKIYSPLFYVEAKMPTGTRLTLPAEYSQRALYLIKGRLRIGSTTIEPLTMPVFSETGNVTIEAEIPSHVILLGGDPFPEQRFIWWNFVSSSEERILQAKADWKAGHFGLIPGDDKEFIPLPE